MPRTGSATGWPGQGWSLSALGEQYCRWGILHSHEKGLDLESVPKLLPFPVPSMDVVDINLSSLMKSRTPP